MAQRDINKIDKIILDNFYKLVHTQAHVRLRAASSTFKILRGMEKSRFEVFNENLNYCVERLVAGLASSRADARRGYGTLLLEILRSYQVSTGRLFVIAQQKFGQIRKETHRDNLIGYLLLISIELESGNFKKGKSNAQYVVKMYNYLWQLLKTKSYLEYPVAKILVQYHDVFKSETLEDINLKSLSAADLIVSILSDSKSYHVNDLLQHCTPNVLRKYLDKLMDDLQNSSDKELQLLSTKQISFIVRRPQLIEDHALILKVAKFLILNSMFKLPSKSYSVQVKKALKAAYHTTMDLLVSAYHSQQRIEQLDTLINYSDHLLKSSEVEKVEKLLDLWSSYTSSLNDHKKLVKRQEEGKQLYPITLLYFLYGLQIVEHELDSKSQLEELAQISVEVLKGDPNDGSWADILTDQIIAILSATECSSWIRKLCESVFGSLLPHISQTSIDLLCDALKNPLDEDDEEGEEDEEMEVDEEADEEADDDVVDEEADEDEVVEEADKDVVEVEDENEVEETDENEVEEADEDEEYLDDEQMMKLDSVLADMFRMNRVGRKNSYDPTFKLRCLDLVKKVIGKKHNDTETINTLLATIIPLAVSSRNTAETRPIFEKIVHILSKMPGKSKYPRLTRFLKPTSRVKVYS